ncbi:uridylate kinase [Labrys sp. LIt4]|uniref:amino acid kinase family protein n=1 Tax=Labrys sp. LIt4 TaxID=2821355 RepID=UPI001ADFCC62|nr:uridylate kinase [Labrys sp. LIt4]MBP0580578.1 uridylate kinase [Labrys sp. LIt4]
MSLTVVKIGGSLCGSARLERLLAQLACETGASLVLVAGGGPFADAVRQVQAAMPFDDGLAHRLALDAMTHLAEILATRHPRLTTAGDREAVKAALRQGRLPIWHPAELRAGHPDITESWAVTSDSLAAWLAAELGADRLILVKSVDAPAASTPAALAAADIVDAHFPRYAARFAGSILVAGPSADAGFPALLSVPCEAS